MDHSEALRLMTEEKKKIAQGNQERVNKQKEAGKATARERINNLFDDKSFVELDALKVCGVVAGFGTVNGRPAYAFAQDVTEGGAAMSAAQAKKIIKVLDQAALTGAPVVMYPDSNGISLAEGAAALNGYSDVMAALVKLSGVCPVICCIAGNCPGTASLFSQLADITIQTGKGSLAFASLMVMQKGADKDKTAAQLFGADVMAAQGGVALTAADEAEARSMIAALLDLLPSCNEENAPLNDLDDLNRVINGASDLDAAALVAAIADLGQTVELNKAYGKNTNTTLCRIGGRTCGVIAMNGEMIGADDMNKIARFVRLCDCYQLPVVTLVNTTGITAPDSCAQVATIKASTRMLYAYAEATTVKLSVLTGKAIGKAYTVLGGGKMADVIYAWPQAQIAAVSEETYNATIGKGDYDDKFSAIAAAKAGLVDDCIDPAETRKVLINAMEFLATKHEAAPDRKHGNISL